MKRLVPLLILGLCTAGCSLDFGSTDQTNDGSDQKVSPAGIGIHERLLSKFWIVL